MAKNLGREFATMDEDERRRFAMAADAGTDSAPTELDFENPRDEPGGEREDADAASAEPDGEATRQAAKRQREAAGPDERPDRE